MHWAWSQAHCSATTTIDSAAQGQITEQVAC
jgi:hypothetical protein